MLDIFVCFASCTFHTQVGAVRYATEAELIMPMCVVLGTLELSDTHVSFFGERFGGPGTGVGKTTKEVE